MYCYGEHYNDVPDYPFFFFGKDTEALQIKQEHLSFTITNKYSISHSSSKWQVLLFFGTLIFHYIEVTVLSATRTDAFEINKITRAEHLLPL
jgi:hypothetical protein